MAHRLETGLKEGVEGSRGREMLLRAKNILGLPISSIAVRSVYLIDVELTDLELQLVREGFTDRVAERSEYKRLPESSFDWIVEVGFKPGVTDNAGRMARVALRDLIARDIREEEHIYTAVQYVIKAQGLTEEIVWNFARTELANEQIQTIKVYSFDSWTASDPDESAPAITDPASEEVGVFDLSGSDEELMQISSDGMLSCSLEEMHAIRDYFTDPATVEKRQAVGLQALPTVV